MNRFMVNFEDLEIEKQTTQKNGGPGSGNFGHAGRPGEVGGSGKGSKGVASYTVVENKS